MTPRRQLARLLILLLGWAALAGCRPGSAAREVVIYADGRAIPLSTQVQTVREALSEAAIELDADDRAEPDLWVEIEDGMAIHVIRIQEEIIVESETMPYEQQTIRSESLAEGEQKLLQAGKNGQIEITYRLQFEDGVEVGRSVLRRVVTKSPTDQITVVGVGGMIDSVQFPGTIAYVNDGNAWIMRNASGGRQPVTTEGELDEHVFALSPDGSDLLYTVATDTVEFDGPFNDLYLLDVVLVGEDPIRLPIQDVLWAGWAPDGQRIAYSTGVKSGPPGWKANNDLWVLRLFDDEGRFAPGKPQRIQSSQNPGAYGWWGTAYAWSPDGLKIAYARADQVGWIDLTSRRAFPLAAFAPLNTHGDWVWVPTPTWSSDSWFVACTLHVDEPGRDPEESQQFEIWAFDIARQVRARLTSGPVGMWSTPRWSPAEPAESQIAYAQAEAPLNSNDSRYTLQLVDRDGSNERQIFPAPGETGLKRPIAHDWSPNARQIVALYLGDLYITDLLSGRTERLTGDGQSTLVEWAR